VNKYKSLNNNPYDIIKSPIINGKYGQLLKNNKYSFNVSLLSNKLNIKKSIEYLFDVKIIKINTKRNLKKNRLKRKKCFKKVIITLKNGNKIDLL